MPGSPQNFSTDPVLASTLLSLELRSPAVVAKRPEHQPDGLHVDGLDPRFRQLWCGGSIVGLGSTESDTYEVRKMNSPINKEPAEKKGLSRRDANRLQS